MNVSLITEVVLLTAALVIMMTLVAIAAPEAQVILATDTEAHVVEADPVLMIVREIIIRAIIVKADTATALEERTPLLLRSLGFLALALLLVSLI